ncbi:MAG: hypothetical protein WA790_10880 [Sulfitobacter sp.]
MDDDGAFAIIIIGKVLFWVLIWYIFWGRKGQPKVLPDARAASPSKADKDHPAHSFGWKDVPVVGPRLKERNRKEADLQRRKEEDRIRIEVERDAAEKKQASITDKPIPPDVRRDMRAFLEGEFIGSDRSPLAYVGYRVGKTRGLRTKDRQERLQVCFRIEIPNDLDDKYQSWGLPASYTRYHAMLKHLRMLENRRSGRRDMAVAVDEWKQDRRWFASEFEELAELFRRYPQKRGW